MFKNLQESLTGPPKRITKEVLGLMAQGNVVRLIRIAGQSWPTSPDNALTEKKLEYRSRGSYFKDDLNDHILSDLIYPDGSFYVMQAVSHLPPADDKQGYITQLPNGLFVYHDIITIGEKR